MKSKGFHDLEKELCEAGNIFSCLPEHVCTEGREGDFSVLGRSGHKCAGPHHNEQREKEISDRKRLASRQYPVLAMHGTYCIGPGQTGLADESASLTVAYLGLICSLLKT